MNAATATADATPKVRRSFDDAFKGAAVDRVAAGETLADVAKDLDIHVNVLRGWKEKAGVSTAPQATSGGAASPRGTRHSVAAPAARATLLESLMAAHGIKVPDAVEVEKGAKAILGLPGREIDVEDARLFAATVLSAV